jgi:hypothetical protein
VSTAPFRPIRRRVIHRSYRGAAQLVGIDVIAPHGGSGEHNQIAGAISNHVSSFCVKPGGIYFSSLDISGPKPCNHSRKGREEKYSPSPIAGVLDHVVQEIPAIQTGPPCRVMAITSKGGVSCKTLLYTRR